jgi:hypothetical protein
MIALPVFFIYYSFRCFENFLMRISSKCMGVRIIYSLDGKYLILYLFVFSTLKVCLMKLSFLWMEWMTF